MAAGFLTHLAGDRIEVRSAGSLPADRVNPAAVEAMKEVGVDITGAAPKVLTTEAVPGLRLRHHHGLRRRLPGLPRQEVPRLGAGGPGRTGRRGGPTHPRWDQDPRRGPDRGNHRERRPVLSTFGRISARPAARPAHTPVRNG
ncbi:arsenate reductase [Streptomyces bottropensis ATCC 25435]|uniref:Arsenate reductase n=1 Tax=Streptomyces bottropensis ATCC 25435 TaxID=1054862 RepID=M3EIR7_9ACTN|nr:arsenate reductase [Streptomyces bottropensis ATCC 25435]